MYRDRLQCFVQRGGLADFLFCSTCQVTLCVLHTFILYSLLYYFRYFCMSRRGVINDYDNLISVTAWNICSCCCVEGNAFDTRQPAAEKNFCRRILILNWVCVSTLMGFLFRIYFDIFLALSAAKYRGIKTCKLEKIGPTKQLQICLSLRLQPMWN